MSILVQEKTTTGITISQDYDVVMHNDQKTTFDFVIQMLMQVFRKSEQEATAIAIYIHEKGEAVVGTYSKDIALSKQQKVLKKAKALDLPLKVSVRHR